MIELLMLVIFFILFMLAVVWSPFLVQHRSQKLADNSFRDQTNIDLYHEHKAEIEKDFTHGDIDQESYHYLLTELDQSLLQDIDENSAEADVQAHLIEKKEKPLSIGWPIVLSCFMLVFSGYYYSQFGAYDVLVNSPAPVSSQSGSTEITAEQQAQLQVNQLLKLTELEPENTEAWFSLAQALVGVGQFNQALTAFDKVIELEGERAELFGAKAQATYYRDGQVINPEVEQLINKALLLDKKDPATHILLGMHNFINNEYQQAIDYWQIVVNDGRANVNVDVLQGAIDEAKNKLLTTNVPQNSALTGPKLSLQVSIADNVFSELVKGEDKVVFIYAIPTTGPRMPVAAVKVQASDLPLALVFTDQSAMTPQVKLSDVDKVNLFAIISSTGEIGIKSGDFKAEVSDVLVSETSVIELVIDSKVD
jgi:cytochrome c-type biogenesis protein CcmH